MIVSADLDGTLIFSQRRLVGDGAVIPVEYRQGEPVGFMTPGAQASLRRLAGRTVFLVNTLRGLEQARRFSFVAEGRCAYLALQNGLYLYRDGVEDRGWSERVRRTAADLPMDLDRGVARVLAGLPGIRCLSKQYEYLAVFFVEEDAFDDSACAQLGAELARAGWELHRQRKKLYLSPAAIHKGTVLERVRDLEGGAGAIGFGDSWFDLPMLRACEAAWSLRDSELWGGDRDLPLRFSEAPAQAGSEEVLARILTGLGER